MPSSMSFSNNGFLSLQTSPETRHHWEKADCHSAISAQHATKFVLNAALPEIPHAHQTARGTPRGQAKKETQTYLEPKWLRLEVWEGWGEWENKPAAFNVNKSLESIRFGIDGLSRVPLLTTI